MNADARVRLLEAISVLVIVACLVAISIPKVFELRRQDSARRVLDDIETVRAAVYRFYSDSAFFPPEGPAGQISDGLAEYLPLGFQTVRPYGTIEYRNWPLRPPPPPAEGETPTPTASNVIGIAVTPRDARIAASASALAYEMPQFTLGGKYVFVLFGS